MARRDGATGVAADPVVKYAEVVIDGVTYRLSYDFNAIAEAEKVADCNLLQGLAACLLNGMTAKQLRGLLFAAMIKAHPSLRRDGKGWPVPLSIDDAGALIRIDTMPEIRDAIIRAYNESLPEAEKIIRNPSEGDGASA